mmetsp:Transcript_12477/g.24924  ORF Transcript_12477/g.24924 Transcript_12477/m.24924 type:complete len:81 (-) Transcript_12477:8-250(-)
MDVFAYGAFEDFEDGFFGHGWVGLGLVCQLFYSSFLRQCFYGHCWRVKICSKYQSIIVSYDDAAGCALLAASLMMKDTTK